MPAVRALIYPAPNEPVPPAPPPYVDVELEGSSGAVHGWFARAAHARDASPVPAILFLHGNGENLGTLMGSPFLAQLLRIPAHLLVIDYPGYGKSRGTPSEHSLVSAALAALRYLKESAAGSPIFVVGWSLGAAVAAQTVARECASREDRPSELAGLALISPWSSLLDVAALHVPRVLARLLLRDRYETESTVRSISVPTLVAHGRYDDLIPVAQGRRVAACAGNLSALIVAKNAQHNNVLEQSQVTDALTAFIGERTRLSQSVALES